MKNEWNLDANVGQVPSLLGRMQEYLQTKFNEFVNEAKDMPIKLAVKVVGLQEFSVGESKMQELGLTSETMGWVLNSIIHINEEISLTSWRAHLFG